MLNWLSSLIISIRRSFQTLHISIWQIHSYWIDQCSIVIIYIFYFTFSETIYQIWALHWCIEWYIQPQLPADISLHLSNCCWWTRQWADSRIDHHSENNILTKQKSDFNIKQLCVCVCGGVISAVFFHNVTLTVMLREVYVLYWQNTVTDQLQSRYGRGQIYTYVGDILVAVNPFHEMEMYTPQVSGDTADLHTCFTRFKCLHFTRDETWTKHFTFIIYLLYLTLLSFGNLISL